MKISETIKETQKLAELWRAQGKVAVVPTMGCLHDGHLALVKKARTMADKVIATIFVNPLQFGKNEDFDRYPRSFNTDAQKLKAEGVDLLFHPDISEMYPSGFEYKLEVGSLAKHMEGKSRPGFFEGVATVCLKLFQISQCHYSVMGEKDFQQLRVLEKLVKDFNLPMSIVRHPTIREKSGLALSSRNNYLSAEERDEAVGIFRAIQRAKKECVVHGKKIKVGKVINLVKEELGAFQVDYVSIAAENDLVPQLPDTLLVEIENPRVFIAAKLGKTRLIDNASL